MAAGGRAVIIGEDPGNAADVDDGAAAALPDHAADHGLGEEEDRPVQFELRDITPAHLRRLVTDMEADGLRPSSIARYVAPLRALLATAAEDGVITRNPWTRIPIKRRQDESQRRHLTDEEVARLLGAAGEDVALALRLLAATGLRRGELLALRWEDVQPRRIRVAHALRGTRRKGRKRGKPYWKVIGAELGRELAQVRAQRGAAEAEPVFVDPATGAAWSPDRFSYRVAKAATLPG